MKNIEDVARKAGQTTGRAAFPFFFYTFFLKNIYLLSFKSRRFLYFSQDADIMHCYAGFRDRRNELLLRGMAPWAANVLFFRNLVVFKTSLDLMASVEHWKAWVKKHAEREKRE